MVGGLRNKYDKLSVLPLDGVNMVTVCSCFRYTDSRHMTANMEKSDKKMPHYLKSVQMLSCQLELSLFKATKL